MQENKGNSKHQLRNAQKVAHKTNCYNKNQETPVSFLHQPNWKAVDDKRKESDLRKSKYERFHAR